MVHFHNSSSENPADDVRHPPTAFTYTGELRPGTSLSLNPVDPFASPQSSRASSIRQPTHALHNSKFSFTEVFNGSQSAPRTPPPDGVFPSATLSHFPRPILNPSRISIIQSGRSSAVPVRNSAIASRAKLPRMRSHRLIDRDQLAKPWMAKPNPRAWIAYLLTYAVIFIGLAGGIVQCYFNYAHAQLDRTPLCLVMEENFDSEEAALGENGSFFREVNMDGFGNGQFEMTTGSRNNSFVKDGFLYIVPTLTSDSIGTDAVFDGTVYNITGCTFNQTQPNHGFITKNGETVFNLDGYVKACSAVSNRTAGAVINPVQSARLTTKGRSSLKFGRVEVRAKMPTGDWLWPAIWMLPRDEAYGPWPRSGEIDIVESRGNGIRYTARGANYVQGSLNWGPNPFLNGVSKSYSWWSERRKTFSSGFRTYALEWTQDWLRIFVDNRLHTLLDIKFNKPFFERGDFPQYIFDGPNLVQLQNPWANGTNATPFDQEFYLIMNVAVGGTNGWFPEAQGDKPWLDASTSAKRDFALARDKWYSTWPSKVEDRAMVVDYVKMWKHCDGN